MNMKEQNNKKDKRIPRLWYVPRMRRDVDHFRTLKKLQGHLEKEKWVNTSDWNQIEDKDWREIVKAPYIFLSRAPLTFGHSQLVIRSPQGNNQNEEDFFCLASKIIEKAIVVFKKAFIEQRMHEEKIFNELAKLTFTKGNYIKTLILRSSANEDNCREYKIHLVPYFESHEISCQKHYTAIHSVKADVEGGLLGWLGQRETLVDTWQNERDNPFNDKLYDITNDNQKEASWQNGRAVTLDDIANKKLKMIEMAKKLRVYGNV